jgi:hypothetical protein
MTQAWKDKADATLKEVLGCNDPDRVDLAHSYLEPHTDGSVSLQRPGRAPDMWSANDLDDKVEELTRLASEVAAINSELTRLNIPVPTDWMSMDTYVPRRLSPRLWEALMSTSTSGPNTPISARAPGPGKP